MIFFHAIEFLILRTLKNARNKAWTSQNHAKSLGVLFSSDAMSKERQLYCLNVWCTVRVESDLRMSKKYFIDVLMFPLFGKISWRKKWLSYDWPISNSSNTPISNYFLTVRTKEEFTVVVGAICCRDRLRAFHSKWFTAAFSQIYMYLSGNWHYYICSCLCYSL